MLPRQDLLGKQIEEFRLDRFIDGGAMGMVFEAQDTILNRKIAVKLIPKETKFSSTKTDSEARAIREARAAACLSHPNIVAIYRYGETADFHYIGMELVRGRTLGRILQERTKIHLEEAISIFDQVLQALEAASKEQIVHRDIKPANIMVGSDQRIKVMDFGIAKIGFQSSTVTGHVLGTPSYMSPEQVAGKKIDTRSDLFSLGAVFYQAVTGVRPFVGDNLEALVYAILTTEPLPVHYVNPDLPAALWPIIHRALSKNPEDRFASPEDMRAALAALENSGSEQPDLINSKVTLEETRMSRAWNYPPGVNGDEEARTGLSPGGTAGADSEAAPVPRPWLSRKTILVTASLVLLSLTALLLALLSGYRWPRPNPNPPAPPPGAGAGFIAELQSGRAEVFTSPGKAEQLWIRIRNSGTQTWRVTEVRYEGFGGWSGWEGPIWRIVAPGTSIDFNETVVVPMQPGNYYYGVFLKSGGVVFSPQFAVLVHVVSR